MTDELVHCVTCGQAFESVELFEVHMVINHGPASARASFDAPRIRLLDLPDEDEDDDDDDEEDELFPHKPARLAIQIEQYRAQAEHAIEARCPDELGKIHDRLENLEAELLRRVSSACDRTAQVGDLRRMVEFVLRGDRERAG